MHDVDGSIGLTFYCGDLPAGGDIGAAGHDPNGYFWEGMVQYLAPTLAGQVEFDSEAGMFAAEGDRAVLEQIRVPIDPYLDDGGAGRPPFVRPRPRVFGSTTELAHQQFSALIAA